MGGESLQERVSACRARDSAVGLGMASELDARAAMIEANRNALESALDTNGQADPGRAEEGLKEAVTLYQAIESLGIMVLRAGGLEFDPARAQGMLHLWCELGAVQEYLSQVQRQWEGLLLRIEGGAARGRTT